MHQVGNSVREKKNALKLQTISTPDGMFQHIYEPLEGRKHDCTLYMRTAVDAHLEEALLIDISQYHIYGDRAYNTRPYLEIWYQGAALSPAKSSINTVMWGSRITVE